MTSEVRLDKNKVQSDNLYRAIGQFTVKFEHVVFSMRQGIVLFLSDNGLKNQQLSNIILSDLTAYPMKSIFGAMIPEISELNDKENKILKSILNRVQKLIDSRNEIIHSTWFVSWSHPDETDFSEVYGQKITRGKTGANLKGFNYKDVDFDNLSDECDAVAELINRLWGIIISGYDISKNFIITDTGDITVPKKSE